MFTHKPPVDMYESIQGVCFQSCFLYFEHLNVYLIFDQPTYSYVKEEV